MDNNGFTFRRQFSAMARERLKFSGISEIIALVESNGALSFGAGEPPDEAFPRKDTPSRGPGRRRAAFESYGSSGRRAGRGYGNDGPGESRWA